MQFGAVFPFSEGLAGVLVGDYPSGKCGFVDRTGKMIISAQFDHPMSFEDRPGPFSEGLASVEVGCMCGYIDQAGRYVVNPQYMRAKAFGLRRSGQAGLRSAT